MELQLTWLRAAATARLHLTTAGGTVVFIEKDSPESEKAAEG